MYGVIDMTPPILRVAPPYAAANTGLPILTVGYIWPFTQANALRLYRRPDIDEGVPSYQDMLSHGFR